MKTILPLAVLGITVASLSSCSKGTYTPPPPPPPFIVGSWSITNSSELERTDSNWYEVESGFDDGVFTFYQNGNAEYAIGSNTLTGTWALHDFNSGYFASDGNYYEANHHQLSINVSNYSGTETIDLAVDVDTWGDTFTGSIHYNDYVDFFEFTRE
ncbi:hypothetical protein A4H97_17805 [Niastella yeongjuensis]|uniref:Lipocalin-like domain-containing protein n=1 Tax=Niastella yeongjuensis TaxID=354355 RepID=A0A1V9E1V7_9BACT|nr:hypothetical protein [Niastella yeongjuensis]OQP40069.1 hypothetical protein A4H97_17805 [Niastella yeongjuensis]SEO15744.1 hypothetical protein SAMN05660816_02306 [Niastella yeongjuensis]